MRPVLMGGGSPPWYFSNPYASAMTIPITSYTEAPGSANVVSALATQCSTAPALYVKQFAVMAKVPTGTPLVTMTGENNFSPTNQIPLGGSFGTTCATLLGELASSDSPLMLLVPGANGGTGYEVWEATPPGATWTCGDGGQTNNLAFSNGAIASPYGESASGLAYLATIITEGDAVFAETHGYFPHTIAMIVSNETIEQWPPAVRYDGGASYVQNDPAEGMWFIMPSTVAMPGGLCTFAQWVFRTWQIYGFIITDRTGGFGCSVPTEYTPDWEAFGGPSPDPINVAFQGQSESTMLNTLPVGDLIQILPPLQGNPPGIPPAGPTGLTVTPGPALLSLSWTTSANVGNVYQSIVAYRVTGSGPNNWTTLNPSPNGGATAAQISGLTGGTGYDVQVWDQNIYGMAASSIATGTPTTPLYTYWQSAIASAASVAYPGAVQPGPTDLLIAAVFATATVTGVSDSVNGAWTEVPNSITGIAGTVFASMWYKLGTAAGTPTVTATTGGSIDGIQVIEYTVSANGALDQSASAQAQSSIVSSGNTATLAAANELAVGWGFGSTLPLTPGTGYSAFRGSTSFEDQQWGSMSGVAATFFSSFQRWIAMVAVFKT